MSTSIEQPLEAAIRKEKSMQIINVARHRHAKLKGRFVVVPNFTPRTQIFVRSDKDEQKVIDRFLSRVRQQQIEHNQP